MKQLLPPVSLILESHSQRLRICQVLHRPGEWDSPLMTELTTCMQNKAQEGDAKRQEEDQAPMLWDCNSPLTKEEYGGTCLNAKKVYSTE